VSTVVLAVLVVRSWRAAAAKPALREMAGGV
jgi:hypothetical protein